MSSGNDKPTPCAKCMNMLGTESRLKIYKLIKVDGENNVTEVVNAVGLTQPTVSYHLKQMQDSGLLVSRRDGKEIYYKINEVCPSTNVNCILSKIDFPESPENA